MKDPILKPSERDSVEALACGLSQQQAAAALGIHIRTLEENLRSARAKLTAQTTYQLVAFAVHGQMLGDMWKSTLEKRL